MSNATGCRHLATSLLAQGCNQGLAFALQVVSDEARECIMAGDSLLCLNRHAARVEASSSEHTSPAQQPPDGSRERSAVGSAATAGAAAARGDSPGPSGGQLSGGCDGSSESAVMQEGSDVSPGEDVRWDLVALKVLLADDRPGSQNGAQFSGS